MSIKDSVSRISDYFMHNIAPKVFVYLPAFISDLQGYWWMRVILSMLNTRHWCFTRVPMFEYINFPWPDFLFVTPIRRKLQRNLFICMYILYIYIYYIYICIYYVYTYIYIHEKKYLWYIITLENHNRISTFYFGYDMVYFH